MKIESLNNDKVKYWCKLKEKKFRDQEGLFLVEGDHLLNEALVQGCVKEIISLEESFQIPDIPFYQVTETIMKKISNQVSIAPVIGVCEKIKPRKIKGNVCILDDIQDPGNLGTIIRSAVAFSIDTIVLSNGTVDLYNEKVVRASEGMIFNLNFIREDLNSFLPYIKEQGYFIYGTDVSQGNLLKKVHFPEKSAIIIGNEGRGMHKEYVSFCDTLLHIPINSYCESLNAGVAASIIFYEMNNVNEEGLKR